MPSRNSRKQYNRDSYYHIYNRGVGQRTIFKEEQDYIVFLSLLKRYLNNVPAIDNLGREYPTYHNEVQLLAFCLMPNHFHLLVYQYDENAISKLMQSLCTAYSMYFNQKYRRVGHLLQDRFKASIITNDSYLQHISRYIHLNPTDYRHWEFSSLPYYLREKRAAWVKPDSVIDLFESDRDYLGFLEDYQDQKYALSEIRHQLANF